MGKTWPEGQGVESGLEPSPAAIATIPVASTAAAAAATTAAAEGPELELPVPPAAAAVAAASIAGLALVLDRADVEGGVHRLDRLIRLRHRPILADVQPDVASHEGHVAVVDQDRLILLDLTDLVVPQGEKDRCGLVPNRRLDELSRFAELRRDLSLFAQPDDLHQDIYLLGGGGQVFHFRHCLFVHAFTSADTSRRVAKGREKPPPGEFRRCGLALLTNRCYKNIRKRRMNDSARSPLSWRTRLGRHQLFSATSRFQRRMLVDAFGRGVTDIRVSVTKRCNFGCIYCHDEGLGPVLKPRMPHEDEMSVEEIERLLRIAREYGIRSVKFTGGEPLIRLDMEKIIDRAVKQIPDVSMTTNGSMLAKRAEGLRSAGLKRVNVSIDALDPAAFREIRKGELAPVLLGIEAALRVGLKPVKLNLVVFKQTLPHIPAMIEHISHGDGLKLQLIQFMPELVGQQEWMVDIDSLKKWLELRADQVLVREMHHRRIYIFNGAEVEVVDPVYNAEFCMNCHRIQVTHQRELKGCLNRNDDLIPTRGLDDDGLRDAFRRVVANRVPYYGAYVKDFPRRDSRAAVPIEFPGVPAA